MSFRQEMSGIALAVIAGAWASVAVGQGQGPGIESLLLPDPDPAPAAKVAEPAATKPAEKASEPEAASAPELTFLPCFFTYIPRISFTAIATEIMMIETAL